tara:strand:+ start:26 stop:2224 length:2199 start_codon:yes stop_codon:yes gene_type:complete
MIKKIVKFLSIIFLILVLAILYLSIFGIETSKFNNQIKNKILESNKRVNLDLKTVRISLSPFDFKANITTFDAKILFNNNEIELESLKTKISLLQIFKNEFLLNNLQISSKPIKAKNLVSLIRYLKNDPKLLFLEIMIKDGHLEGNIDLNFDKKGRIKNNYKINGSIKNLKIKKFNNYDLDNLSFIFAIKDKKYKFLELDTRFNKIRLNSPSIEIKEIENSYLVNGKILSNKNDIPINLIKNLLNSIPLDLDLKNINLVSENDFSFKVNKKFKFSNININSEINLSKLTYKNNFLSIKKYFPDIKEEIDFKDHKIKFSYNKDIATILGSGKILIEDNEDKIDYEITKKDKQYFFKKKFRIKDNIFLINEIEYKKDKDKEVSIKIDGVLNDNKEIFFNEISLVENENSILIKNLNLDSEFKISSIGLLELDYKNQNKVYNQIYLKKNKEDYIIEGKSFDASKFIDNIMNSNDEDSSIFSNLNSKINIKINKTYIDNINFINNLSGNLQYKNNKINDLKLDANFPNKKIINLSIKKNTNLDTITRLSSSYPKALIKRYDFIKGFEEGYLDFYSSKKNDLSNSVLVIDNFKVKEAPVFAKLLSLASLQGVSDLLTGEGIRFTDFEMKFSNQNDLTTIQEMYAIGPAVSILMDGYIEDKKLVSLRGTLVPATTINRTIASIPFLGKILIGDKTGEGVFGVSFKIKGPPKDLKTTVNPIKTLTPRFITRTLEKIKKN